MKTAILVLSLALTATAQAQPSPDAACIINRADLPVAAPRFEAYPAKVVPLTRLAPLDTRSPQARQFRTVLREQAAQGPDFAGHLKLALIGCGADCLAPAIIDETTGAVSLIPGLTNIVRAVDGDLPRLTYQLDSRLLIANGAPNEDAARSGVSYYLWSPKGVTLLRHISYAELCAHRAKN